MKSPSPFRIIFPVCLTALAVGRPPAMAADGRLTITRTAGGGAAVEVDGKPFATYVVDQTNKPYLWPIYGPTGKPMTRAYPMQDLPEEPAAQRDHPHHRGLTFGLENAGDSDTWHDRSTFEEAIGKGKTPNQARLATLGRIVHREFTRLDADGDRAVIEEVCDHVDSAGHPFLVERRRLTFRATGQTRSIDVDQELACPQPRGDAAAGPVRIDDRKDSGLLIRVPTTMAVDSKQGGRIVNSDGLVDKDAWSKPARWCDYHGPVAGEQLGIAILNHPASHRHPTRWHVRTYGLFTANPFASKQYDPALPDGTTTIEPGEVLRLHHRFLFHAGDEKAGGVEEAWRSYAAETPRPIEARD